MQLSITLSFALIEYKIQGATFDNIVIHQKRHSRRGIVTHKRFYSNYVQLSRLLTFANLGLLWPINITNINNQPNSPLHDKNLKLDNVNSTMSDA